MNARQRFVPLGILAGVIFASGLAGADPSREPPPNPVIDNRPAENTGDPKLLGGSHATSSVGQPQPGTRGQFGLRTTMPSQKPIRPFDPDNAYPLSER